MPYSITLAFQPPKSTQQQLPTQEKYYVSVNFVQNIVTENQIYVATILIPDDLLDLFAYP